MNSMIMLYRCPCLGVNSLLTSSDPGKEMGGVSLPNERLGNKCTRVSLLIVCAKKSLKSVMLDIP